MLPLLSSLRNPRILFQPSQLSTRFLTNRPGATRTRPSATSARPWKPSTGYKSAPKRTGRRDEPSRKTYNARGSVLSSDPTASSRRPLPATSKIPLSASSKTPLSASSKTSLSVPSPLSASSSATRPGIPATLKTKPQKTDKDDDNTPSNRQKFLAIKHDLSTLKMIYELGLGSFQGRKNDRKGYFHDKMVEAKRRKMGLHKVATEDTMKGLVKFPKLRFVSRTNKIQDIPAPTVPEVAFVGRSNVGKSSLLNAIVGRTTSGNESTGWSRYAAGTTCPKNVREKIARRNGKWQYPAAPTGEIAPTDEKPGCTRHLNFYLGKAMTVTDVVGGESRKREKDSGVPFHVVDMPGYGFALATEEERVAWNQMMHAYLSDRRTLHRIYVLIDARHGLKIVDKEFLGRIHDTNKTVQVILTKCDELAPELLAKRHWQTTEDVKSFPRIMPDVLMVSSRTGAGMDRIRRIVLQSVGIVNVRVEGSDRKG